MPSRTVIRSTLIFLGLLLMSLLMLFVANEYEKNMAFQWENMVQPHWEGAVPQEKLMLPLVNDKAKDIVITPDESAEDESSTAAEETESEPVVTTTTKKTEEKPSAAKQSAEITKKPEIKKIVTAKVAVVPPKTTDNKAQSAAQKVAITQKRALKLRVSEDNLYRNHPAKWELKKQKMMPDFFAPKTNDSDGVQMAGHLIMDDDETSGAGSGRKKKNEEDASYLDSIQGAELNFSIKMR